MFIVLPLGHERMEAQRLPVLTIGIIALNVFFYLVTLISAPKSNEQAYLAEYELYAYYSERPYLEMPPDVISQLLPEHQHEIQFFQKDEVREAMESFTDQTGILTEALEDDGLVDRAVDREARETRLRELRRQEQVELNDLIQKFQRALNGMFYRKYGYIPSQGNIFTMFSSMFLHGGFMHLFGNMLFLWLSGCNIEDLWGRLVYPIFYILGGIFAAILHGVMFPQSDIPLIGASGAIAAVMGAFLIRLYSTKIYFVYFILLGFRPIRGRFTAPAYVMLPLWFLQQLWEGFMSAGGSGVAFWAHVGGFVFGAVIALGMKFSGIEEKYIAPALDKKTAVLDEHVATGMTKLQEGDVDGALLQLKEAAKNNPDDPIVHGELTRAYIQKGDKKLAQREFKRVVHIYMKQNRQEEAVNEYLELSAELPELMLDPPQQAKMAAAIREYAASATNRYADVKEAQEKERELYTKSALAYRQLIMHYQTVAKSLESLDAVHALTGYGDLCLQHLETPKDAYKAYMAALKSPQLTPEQQQELQAKAQHAMQKAAEQAKQPKPAPAQTTPASVSSTSLSPAPAGQTVAGTALPHPAPASPSKPEIPIQKRIKVITQTADAPAKYAVKSVAPVEANKISPIPGGIDLNRPSDKPLLFHQISVICVSQVTKVFERVKPVRKRGGTTEYQKSLEKHETLVADLFLVGRSRPYRLEAARIDYSRFFPKPLESVSDNLRQFVLYIIAQLPSVYLDQGTVNFLKTGKPQAFSTEEDLTLYEKIFWKQLMGAVRFQCEHCWETYWVDGIKIPAGGATTKCAKCGQPISVQKPAMET